LDRINADLDKLSSEIPTGKKEKVEKIAVKINEKINSIIGVDEKIYGPFAPEDVVILPKLNADILIDDIENVYVIAACQTFSSAAAAEEAAANDLGL
jgi:DNA replication initiation complex subunit (GINS family)